MILQEIYEQKCREVEAARRRQPFSAVLEGARHKSPARGFARAVVGRDPASEPRVAGRQPRLIAEIKKASPSVGLIRDDFNPVLIARAYERGGAAALSCLTDEKFFKGRLYDLKMVRAAVDLPVLRKEFLIDPYQVWEARAAGADAVLLIAGFVNWDRLGELREAAREAGLDVLLEIHNLDELEPALALEPELLGVNNRDLHSDDFRSDLAVTERIAPEVPAVQPLVSESGIRSAADVDRLARIGVDAILVGEHLMREPDPGAAIARRLGLTY